MSDRATIYISAITPRGNHGEIDFGAFFELIDFANTSGLSGIALFGPAGEYAALRCDERSRLLYLAVKRSRLPVLAGVGAATMDDSVTLAREARDAGAAALLLPPPYFYQYDQSDIREFYLEFAAHVGRGASVYLANTPEYTSSITPETARELMETGLFAGMADSSWGGQSWPQPAFSGPLLSANDATFLKARTAGVGVISEIACALPELPLALDNALVAGRHAEVERLDRMLHDFLAWMQQFPPLAALKTAAAARGLKAGPLSIPIPPDKRMRLEEFSGWFRGALAAIQRASAKA